MNTKDRIRILESVGVVREIGFLESEPVARQGEFDYALDLSQIKNLYSAGVITDEILKSEQSSLPRPFAWVTIPARYCEQAIEELKIGQFLCPACGEWKKAPALDELCVGCWLEKN